MSGFIIVMIAPISRARKDGRRGGDEERMEGEGEMKKGVTIIVCYDCLYLSCTKGWKERGR